MTEKHQPNAYKQCSIKPARNLIVRQACCWYLLSKMPTRVKYLRHYYISSGFTIAVMHIINKATRLMKYQTHALTFSRKVRHLMGVSCGMILCPAINFNAMYHNVRQKLVIG